MGIIPSITGKIELVYEGEQEGPVIVAHRLIGKAIRSLFVDFFPNPEELRRTDKDSPYTEVTQWFSKGGSADLLSDMNQIAYEEVLLSVPSLRTTTNFFQAKADREERFLLMEFLLHGLSEYSLLGKSMLESGARFGDLIAGMLDFDDDEDEFYGEEMN